LALAIVPVEGFGEELRLASMVFSNSRFRRVLRALAEHPRGKMETKPLLYLALGRVSKKDHWVLRELASLGLIRRYPGHNDDGRFVVWNEVTELGRRVLEIVEEMEG